MPYETHAGLTFVTVGSHDNIIICIQESSIIAPPGPINEQMNERYKMAFRLVKFSQNCVHSNARV